MSNYSSQYYGNVADPRYSSASSNAPQQFTQSVSQFLPSSNQQSQHIQPQQQAYSAQLQAPSPNTYYTTSVVYQQPPTQSQYSVSYNTGNVASSSYGNQNNQPNPNNNSGNIQDVIESVKRSAALRQSQQQSNQPQVQVVEPNYGNSTFVNSQYIPYDSNMSNSFNPSKQQQQLQQPQQYTNYLSQSQSGLANSSNLSVPQYSGMGYYQTPDRSVQIKSETGNIKFLTPNKSPSSCKIVSRSPTKQQIEREIDVQNQQAMQEHVANQNSVNNLKSTIDFIAATNASPEKRHTAKSIITQMNGPVYYQQ